MELPSVSIQPAHTPELGVLVWRGEFNENAADSFRRHLHDACDYYHYDRVQLNLDSPGGSLRALETVITALQRAEERGVQVEVLARFRCASAAALVLSAGSGARRTVGWQTHLLFHFGRIQGDGQLTADAAGKVQRKLSAIDTGLLGWLIRRLERGAGGHDALRTAVQLRTAQYLAQRPQIEAQLAGPFSSPADQQKAPAWLGKLVKLADCERESFGMAYKRTLQDLMKKDCVMPVTMAWCLALVDEVEMPSGPPLTAARHVDPDLIEEAEQKRHDEDCRASPLAFRSRPS